MNQTSPFLRYDNTARFCFCYIGRPAVRRFAAARGRGRREDRKRLKTEYIAVLSRTEDIPGAPLRFNIVWGCLMIALLNVFPDLSNEELTWAVRLVVRSRLLNFLKKRLSLFDKMSRTAAPYKATGKNDWGKEVDTTRLPEEFTVNYTQCGLVELFRQEGKLQRMPQICQLDYVMFGGTDIDLIRTETLAAGAPHCGFRMLNRKIKTAEAVMRDEGIDPETLK